MYDTHLSEKLQSNFALFSFEDIDSSLEAIRQVRFQERIRFQGKGEGVEAMAHCAGREVGAAVWKFTKAAETVLYAVDFGHTKDKGLLLNPCDIARVKRPSVLITDGMCCAPALEDKSYSPAYPLLSGPTAGPSAGVAPQTAQTAQLERFFDQVLTTLSTGGDAFIPVDTCGRSLDLIHQFESFWTANQAYAQHKGALPVQYELKRFVSSPIFFLTNVAYSTIEFAKAQLEWMNDTYSNQFCDSRANIWNLQYVQLVHSIAEVSRVSRPRVILCSTEAMDSGFSFDLFTQLAPLKTTNLIFTYRASSGSLAHLLQKKYILKENLDNLEPKRPTTTDQSHSGDQTASNGHSNGSEAPNKPENRYSTLERSKFSRDFLEDTEVVTIFGQAKRVPLEGNALEEYRARKKIEREEWEARKKAEREAEALRLQEEQKLNEEKSIDHGSRIFDLWRGYDLTADAMQKVRARGQHPLFPYIEPRTAFDDYGELFRLPSVLQEEEERRRERNAAESAEYDDDPPPVEETVPTTSVIQDISILIHAKISFVDLEGRCDLRTFQNTVTNEVKPLAIAFVHTPTAYQQSLTPYFKRMGRLVHFPTDGQVIDVASHRHMRNITIEHTTYKDLQFFSLLDYQVAIVNGAIAGKTVDKDADKVKEDQIAGENSDGAMQVDVPASEPSKIENGDLEHLEKQIAVLELDKAATSDKEKLFIGDLKLREFKELLDRHPRGFKTGISGAILTVNDVVTVQREGKAGQSTLVVDGPLCDTYFLVRALLYSKLTNL